MLIQYKHRDGKTVIIVILHLLYIIDVDEPFCMQLLARKTYFKILKLTIGLVLWYWRKKLCLFLSALIWLSTFVLKWQYFAEHKLQKPQTAKQQQRQQQQQQTTTYSELAHEKKQAKAVFFLLTNDYETLLVFVSPTARTRQLQQVEDVLQRKCAESGSSQTKSCTTGKDSTSEFERTYWCKTATCVDPMYSAAQVVGAMTFTAATVA